MRTSHFAILILGLGALVMPTIPRALNAQEPVEEADDGSRQELLQKLEETRAEYKLAKLRMDNLLRDQDLGRMQAIFHREDTMATLQSYRMLDGEASREQAILDLQYQKDSLADAEEELRQLGMMYDLNNLADATAQIVMERAGRNVDRMKTEVTMAEKQLTHYLEFGQPREQLDLEREAELAEMEMAALDMAHAYDRAEAEMELKDLQQAIRDLEMELAESDE